MTFLTKCQFIHLVKKDKQKNVSSKWPRLNQINHTNLTFTQIGHINLAIKLLHLKNKLTHLVEKDKGIIK
jgi:hypothetical protein